MKFLFVVGCVAFVMFLIWGIISKFQKKKSRWKLLGALLSLVVVLIAAPAPEDSNTSAEIETQTALSTNADNNIFSEDTEGFTSNFNAIVEEHNVKSLKITELEIEAGKSATTFKYSFNNYLQLLGTLNNDGNIQEAAILGQADLTTSNDSGINLMNAINVLILTTNKDYGTEDAQEILEDLRLFEEHINLNEFKQSTVRDGIKYRLAIIDKTQIMFSVIAD